MLPTDMGGPTDVGRPESGVPVEGDTNTSRRRDWAAGVARLATAAAAVRGVNGVPAVPSGDAYCWDCDCCCCRCSNRPPVGPPAADAGVAGARASSSSSPNADAPSMDMDMDMEASTMGSMGAPNASTNGCRTSSPPDSRLRRRTSCNNMRARSWTCSFSARLASNCCVTVTLCCFTLAISSRMRSASDSASLARSWAASMLASAAVRAWVSCRRDTRSASFSRAVNLLDQPKPTKPPESNP